MYQHDDNRHLAFSYQKWFSSSNYCDMAASDGGRWIFGQESAVEKMDGSTTTRGSPGENRLDSCKERRRLPMETASIIQDAPLSEANANKKCKRAEQQQQQKIIDQQPTRTKQKKINSNIRSVDHHRLAPKFDNYHKSLWTPIISLIGYVILYKILIAAIMRVDAIAPTIDYSHNMRILKLPKSTPMGSLIYRLRGSDGDPNSQLMFGVSGIEGRALLDIVPVARSWNEADVYLRGLLEEPLYNLTIYVTDGNKTTQVESTIIVTDDTELPAESHDNDNNRRQPHQQQVQLPFVNPRHVFHVPENTQPDEPIGFVTALESQKSDLPVRFELRGKGADKFSIKYVFGPKGQSKAEIVLAQALDYEQQNLFTLKVLALNAWTNSLVDTRNVASMDIVITVDDVQDTAPVFKRLPQSLHLANTMGAGDLVAKLEAEDGDYGDQRPINYALDANSHLASYFSMDKTNGELRLLRPMSELALNAAAWASGGWPPVLSVFASEQTDPSSYDHLWPPMFARAELPVILVDLINEPPQFVGGWQSGGDDDEHPRLLHGYLNEQQLIGLADGDAIVSWFTNYSSSATNPLFDELIKSVNGRPSVVDLGLGPNGTFELSLEGPDAELFQLDPVLPVSKQSAFNIMVAANANRSLFDRERSRSSSDSDHTRPRFSFDLVARDFGTAGRKSSRIRCSIELMDANDNAPQFDTDLYSLSVYENAPVGQVIGSVRARDSDTGDGARVRYTALTGRDQQVFRLDPDNGQITLEGHLDFEKRSLYMFLVEARDFKGAGNANYSHVMINVLDVNDNAPVFLQSHYDAVLLADGTFHQPPVVRAVDADEPGTANSQVAYEIVAGNQNEQFSIDSVSGVIYPTGGAGPDAGQSGPIQVPSVLLEPISPFGSSNESPNTGKGSPQQHQVYPELAGKILPNHEVEDLPRNGSSGPRHRIQVMAGSGIELRPRSLDPATAEDDKIATSNRSTSFGEPPALDHDQLPGLDLLMNLESEAQPPHKRALTPQSGLGGGARLPPVTTLVVRAHDFGIPLRSSTVKVNIYNQALLSRLVSLILNGTAEQLELRREAIERAFSSIVGSRATIESIDALSESSSISVARARLAIPQHSLVDLTDLSALMSAIDYHPTDHNHNHHHQQQQRNPIQGQFANSGLLVPVANVSSNMSQGTHNHLYSDISSFALDVSNQLERRLLIYIIIVGVCILALLVIWMIYSCSRETDHLKIIEKSIVNRSTGSYQRAASSSLGGKQQSAMAEQKFTTNRRDVTSGGGNNNKQTIEKTQVKTTADSSAIGNNLAKSSQPHSTNDRSLLLGAYGSMGNHLNGGELTPATTTIATFMRPDHYSMYNGQVWFEPGGATLHNQQQQSQLFGSAAGSATGAGGRRASSAPSAAASLDSALHAALHVGQGGSVTPRQATGQFFPNTIGYMENLASMSSMQDGGGGHQVLVPDIDYAGRPLVAARQHHKSRLTTNKRNRRRKVAPMVMNGYNQPHWLVVAQPPAVAPSKPPRNSPRLMVDGNERAGHSNEAFEHDLESGRRGDMAAESGLDPNRDSRSSSAAGSSSGESIVLNSDQELLGFDSNGTPIIASHQRQVRHSPRPGECGTISRQAAAQSEVRQERPPESGAPRLESTQVRNNQDAGARGFDGSPDRAADETLATAAAASSSDQLDNSDTIIQANTEVAESRKPPIAIKVDASPPTGASRQTNKLADSRDQAPDLMGELNERLAKRRQSADAAVGQAVTKPEGRVRGRLERAGVNSSRASSAGSANSGGGGGGGNSSGTSDQLLIGMQNGELLEKQSIFAITYSGLATDKLPVT